MGTSRCEIGTWFDRGVREGYTHMIVMTDTYDYFDYPVYVTPKQDARKVAAASVGNMQVITEVYNLSLDKDRQLSEYRAKNY